MKRRIKRTSRGFTLIETLVVVAVVAILTALFLPAVQQARVDARQSRCKNNMKQLGLALHNYHDVHRVFAPGWVAHHADAQSVPSYGWQTMILPFVDQAPLYNQIQFEKPMPKANKLLQTNIQVYRCPTDPTEKTNSMRGNYGTSNYSGNFGNVAPPRWAPGRMNQFWPGGVDTPLKANGIFHWNSSVRFRDIVDGTSHTFLAGERCVTSAAGIWPGIGANRFENDAVSDGSFGNEINSGITAFSSRHRGGANFLKCDGAVRFISQNIDSRPGERADMGTFQKLSQRDDGQVIGDY